MSDLPVDIDTTYEDEVDRPSRKLHQQHHDVIHGFVNLHPDDPDAHAAAIAAATAGTVLDDDARLTDARTPSGPAGGVLAGTYPDPTFAADLATQAELDAIAAAKANTSHSHVDADLPAGIARDTEVTAAVVAHTGEANPHPGYLTPAEGDAAYDALGTAAAGDALLLPKAGGTLTGPLVLPGDAAAALQATPLQQVQALVAALVDSAPGTLDTLNELAAALGDDPNFATTITTALAGKQPLDADLTAIAALGTTAFGRDLLALADAAAGRTALALGTAAVEAAADFQPVDADLTAIAALTTTAFGRSLLAMADAAATKTALSLAKADVGLADVDNTSDADKPVSTAQQTAIDVHPADTSAAHAAASVAFTPAGAIAATNVQAAIEEVATEAGGSHPDLAAHDTLGLATQAELDAHEHVGDFAGVKVTRLSNVTVANNAAVVFDAEIADPDGWWSAAAPTKLIVPAGKGGWYWVGADITTLGTTYGGPANTDVQLCVEKNWDGTQPTLLASCVAYQRYSHGNGTSARAETLLQPILLAAGDELQLALIGPTSGGLLVESNPSDGLPSGYLTDDGPGTLSPHFFAIPATGPAGPQGAPGADGDMTWEGAWSAVTAYTLNQVVEHNGSAYVAIVGSTNSAPPSANWELLASKGDQGIQGIQGEPGGGASLPTGYFLKDYATATRTSGNVTLNTVGPTNVDTGLDLVLDAAIGDLVEYSISGLVTNVAQYVGFDVYTIVGGSPVNAFGPGLSASLAGVQAWYCRAVAEDVNVRGSAHRVLVSGDISAGTVTLRLRYGKLNTTARALYATANNPFTVTAKVWSPFA